jgi:hypothetical protein
MDHPKAVGDRTTLAVMFALTSLGYSVRNASTHEIATIEVGIRTAVRPSTRLLADAEGRPEFPDGELLGGEA